MLGGETQNTHLLVTAVPKCKEEGPASRVPTGALGLCDSNPPPEPCSRALHQFGGPQTNATQVSGSPGGM